MVEADEKTIRQYLLGELAEAEVVSFEERLMTDEGLFEMLQVIEDELMDEHAAGELSADEQARFDSYFLATPERRERLEMARDLHDYARRTDPVKPVMSFVPGAADDSAKITPLESLSEPVAKDMPSTATVIRPARWSVPRRYLTLAAAAVILLALGLGVWRTFFYQSDVSKGLEALNRAYRQQRPTEARISGMAYAPLPRLRGNQQEKVDTVARDRAERILFDEAETHPSPQAYHALGQLYLAEHKFDEAIAQYEKALKGAPNSAQFHSDYGVALLELGKAEKSKEESGKSLEYFAKALEQFNRALELDGSLLDALFNRALCHQYLMLPGQAEEDWHQYLEKDPNSKWADEARQNLKQVEEQRQKTSQTKEDIFQVFLNAYQAQDDEKAWQIVSQSREALSGKLVSEQLLDAYLEASIKGRSDDANDTFQALLYLGNLEARKAGDRYTSGLAQFYRLLSDKQRETLAQARGLMKLGRECYVQSKSLEAIEKYYHKAREMLAGLGDEWEAESAELSIAYCYLQAANTQQSIAILERLIRSFEKQNYKWLLMRALHALSGAEYNLNNYSKGIDYNYRSLAIAEQIGDLIGIFSAATFLIEQYRYIGNYSQSLRYARRSLSMIDSCALNANQIAQHYGIIASSLASSGFFSAAVDYQKEALRLVLAIGNVLQISRAYVRLGLLYGKAENYAEALKSTRFAYEAARSHPDESISKMLMALSLSQVADIYRETGEIGKAIDNYDQCIELYNHLDFHYGLYEAHKNRLFCYISQGDDALASEELQTTLSLVEKYRSTILDGDNRNNFFDKEQSVYDLAIGFEQSRVKNTQRAFEYSEESRARSLLDLISRNVQVFNKNEEHDVVFNAVSRPLKFGEIQTRIPDQAQILQYAVLNNKLLIWVVSKAGFSTVEKEIAQQELTEKIFNYLHLVDSTSGGERQDISGEAKSLFDILIKPVEPLLDRNKLLCVVGDKALNALPFAALVSSDSGRFLLEDYLLVSAPSSSLFVICSEMADKKAGAKIERLLSVGNPRFDRRAFPSLPDLPSAQREAEEVAAYYNSTRVLVGDSAREDRIKNEMTRADVIHLALHSLIEQRSPMNSKLLLTAERKDAGDAQGADGILQAYELYNLNLTQARIVILSACQTGVERYYNGEGMINIARPFMAAGVPLVVVSLWPVDSDSTAELMISFHKHRKRDNLSTAESLRRAQLEMLNSPDERLNQPYYWAPFMVIGGCASF